MNKELSRVEKYGRGRNRRPKKEQKEQKQQAAKVEAYADVYTDTVPLTEEEAAGGEVYVSRAELFPSRRIRVSKWFMNFLSTLFVLITAALLWWGIEGAPPLHVIMSSLSDKP
ncbi:hypothetical protein OIN60_07825 [Paenibacillus sp. P96]|uniref:Uncharacterized protein n=1 Tax=Paenibacillus zeirhizosphaerae TaxID=2987519 RepID=A0ABT9FPM8_9BACL|nr:hypothetical protein [Paenibacillus sp. P96]MDP4096677.1 hypothetical protein [Paenibacillus sp. P96]